jgi:hypothetical protein
MQADERIYRLLIEGLSASQIVKKTKLSKGYISKIIRRLEKGGYILCINRSEKPRFYVSTKKPFTPIKFPDSTPDKTKRLSHRLNMVEIQKSTFQCRILIPPTKATWDSEYEWRTGVIVQQYSYPFRDFGVIRFRRFISKNKDKLIIILPRICLHKDEVTVAEDMLRDYAVKACKWIKKKFDMPVSDPVMCQKPQYAVPLREPELIDAIEKNGTYKVGEIEADKSPPHLIPEIESTDSRDVVNYLDSIRKIKNIEKELINNRNLIHEILDKMEIMGENQANITGIITMLTQPRLINKPDTFSDVV